LILKYLADRIQVASEVKITTLIELIGIKIAATKGDKCPVTATETPITL
jgi:hypothetical protein